MGRLSEWYADHSLRRRSDDAGRWLAASDAQERRADELEAAARAAAGSEEEALAILEDQDRLAAARPDFTPGPHADAQSRFIAIGRIRGQRPPLRP